MFLFRLKLKEKGELLAQENSCTLCRRSLASSMLSRRLRQVFAFVTFSARSNGEEHLFDHEEKSFPRLRNEVANASV